MVIAAFVIDPLLMLWAAFALLFNYNMFIAGIPGAPQFTFMPCVGAILLARQLISPAVNTDDKNKSTVNKIITKKIAVGIMVPSLMIGLGWFYDLTLVGWLGVR